MKKIALLSAVLVAILSLTAQAQRYEQILFKKGDYGYHTFRIPALVQTKSGAILAFAEARRNSGSDTGDIDLVMKRSTDGGKTWSEMMMAWDDAENVCGNPSPVVDSRSGRIILTMT